MKGNVDDRWTISKIKCDSSVWRGALLHSNLSTGDKQHSQPLCVIVMWSLSCRFASTWQTRQNHTLRFNIWKWIFIQTKIFACLLNESHHWAFAFLKSIIISLRILHFNTTFALAISLLICFQFYKINICIWKLKSLLITILSIPKTELQKKSKLVVYRWASKISQVLNLKP